MNLLTVEVGYRSYKLLKCPVIYWFYYSRLVVSRKYNLCDISNNFLELTSCTIRESLGTIFHMERENEIQLIKDCFSW